MFTKKTLQLDLFEQLGLPLIIFNEDCSVINPNKQCIELFNLPKNLAIVDISISADKHFYSEDGRPLSAIEFLHQCAKRSQTRITSQTIGADSVEGARRKWFKVTIAPLDAKHEDIQQYIASFTDITETISAKESHSQIVQAKNEWETTVDALQDIVTIQNRDMEIVRANKAAHELFGFKLGDLTDKKCYEAFLQQEQPCQDCPVSITGVDSCPHSGLMYNEHVQKTFRVSSFPIISEDGQMRQLVHVAQDVSQYLKDESEKNRLMAAIEQTSESIVMTDVNANIEYVNPAFERISGYSKDEAIGLNTRILRSGEHAESFYQQMWDTVLNKKVWQGKVKNRNKSGEIYIEDATISPVLNGDGEIVNFVALKRDITREEQLEGQLHHSSKIEALGTLAGGIAHDFNNILSAMIGYGEIAKGKLDLTHPAQADIQQILDGGDRAVDLVKQILTFSRREVSGEFCVVNLQHIVSEIVDFLRPSLPPTIDITIEIDDGCGSVNADASQLYQVIMNLCTNARQAIGDAHGSIDITLKQLSREEKGDLVQIAEAHGEYLLLQVRDNGCGIEQDNIRNLFDPFFTTKQKEQGTGLGLSVVHGIVEKHKGVIEVESTVRIGSIFSIYLPVDGRDPRLKPTNRESRVGGNQRIMVIDDEEQVANVTATCLKKVGYRVSKYNDSMQAVTAFREDPYCCDLVITDMLMPNMTGAELSREMLSIRKDLPIIMMTGYSEHFDAERSAQIGLKDYIFKPVRNEKLRQIVKKVLESV